MEDWNSMYKVIVSDFSAIKSMSLHW